MTDEELARLLHIDQDDDAMIAQLRLSQQEGR